MIELPIWLVVVVLAEIGALLIWVNVVTQKWERAERDLVDLRWRDFERRHPEIAEPRAAPTLAAASPFTPAPRSRL